MKSTMEKITPEILRFVRYLSFKADCLREQQENPLKIDRVKAQEYYDQLEAIVEEKKQALSEAMPKIPNIKYHNKPKILYKKDGSYSANGIKWFETLQRLGQPRDSEGPVAEVLGYDSGNPNSDPQLKEWLFYLGWRPCTFKFERDKETGEERKIPQVRYFSNNDPRKGELTDSVKSLIEKEPALEALDGLTVAKHRLSVFAGFLSESDENGYCGASAGGFTNTMRLQHRKPFVNMPKADGEVAWGKEIRSCIVAPEGYEMCGSDIVSLEDTTKRHYMKPFDPDYVEEMEQEGFDPHLNLAIFANAISQEELDEKGAKDPHIKSIRKQYKAANYAGIYGVGAVKLARELFIGESKARAILDAYWQRNWSVREVANRQFVKTLKDGSLWLKNPVSGFYYSLRYTKDTFSTLNQGTGVFIFDSWLMRVRRKGVIVQGQMHDEVFFKTKPEEKSSVIEKLNTAMQEVNKSLQLNVEVRVDIQFGENYAEVH